MRDYEEIHRQAEEFAKVWYEDEKLRADTLKEIIMKELHTKGYWHVLKLEDDMQKAVVPVVKESVTKCLCSKIKELFNA